MGIYGALSSAVTGLRAQSHALENISGNIANSQTTGYKRIETDFLDLIPDAPIKRQVPGAVLAQSRGTNDIAGDIKTVSNETYIALNSNGFFVVEPKVGQSDGNSVFAGTNFYTRRGDFEIDKDGMLVNGAGYYLKGLPIDPGTGNISGSVPEVIKLSNAFLPAQQTNRINYQANLPQMPKPTAYKATVPNSELFRAADYVPGATFSPAVSQGSWGPAVADLTGDQLTVSIGGSPFTYHFQQPVAPATLPTGNATNMYIDTSLAPNNTMAGIASTIQTHMQTRTGAGTATVAFDTGTNNLTVTLPSTTGVALSVTKLDAATGSTSVAFTDTPATSSVPYGQAVNEIPANKNTQFLSNSISGGAITVYAENGAPANVQMRWAKVSNADTGGGDVWHLYYMSNSEATPTQTQWTRVQENFQFAPNGSLASPTNGQTTLNNLTVNGVNIGDVEFRYDTNGLSQFADVNGTANVSTLNQNGYGAGEFISVAINDNGRVVATYSNGERIDMAQVVTAEFNAINQLKRLDGGVFTATSESGEAILDLSGTGVIGGSLEASNTDISDEFTKLIVTQQAYAAGTRIVSTADEMLQEALNMIR
ncbi:flagellar hook protein FlgE [Devosia sp. YR412]|uniref:flagellar hook protein FlgE n=1 Tax=Devosia sp. YR412 TaxID=1881030 RepID=UPI0008CA46FF|nr:flagellar hook-basal body complex protein [Devosia sp. YR412]SEP99133.1 flagellar hook protein FlgE [Devosia sp. YR412]